MKNNNWKHYGLKFGRQILLWITVTNEKSFTYSTKKDKDLKKFLKRLEAQNGKFDVLSTIHERTVQDQKWSVYK